MEWLGLWRYGVLLLALVGCSQQELAPSAGTVPPNPLTAEPSRAALTGEAARLVKDINAIGFSSLPQSLTNVNGTLYFVATDSANGRELWKSDGTAAGTVLVKDIFPGAGGSFPQSLTNVNGTLYFMATDGLAVGQELWKSDGTAAGTVLVKDIFPGSGNSNPQSLTNVNGTLYFMAIDGVNGQELWKSDGTAAGTVLVKDILPGSGSAGPGNLTAINGTLFFMADDGVNGPELWKSDGTAAGTVLLKDINPGSGGASPENLTNVNGTLYFSASNSTNGLELWKSDGTAAGTALVKDINPGSGGAGPQSLTSVNGTLYFSANDSANGRELWKSDGTATGTVLVKDIYLGSGNSIPQFLTNVNGTLYFRASEGVNGQELWKSDGTAAGTVLVKDISPGSGNSLSQQLTNVNGTLYFMATDVVAGQELWKSDGTAAGTVLVKDINQNTDSASPANLAAIDGTIYFSASDGMNGSELWKSDGTAAGTVLVKDIRPGEDGSSPHLLTNVNGTLYFSANDGVNGQELWKSDGTAAGTVLVKDIVPGVEGSSPLTLTNINGTLYFSADDRANGRELWRSDGTAAGTALVKDIFPGSGGSGPLSLTNVNGTLYFRATDNVNDHELWKSDGTAAGTVLVKDINPGSGTSNPGNLTNVNGTLYFNANNGVNGSELWKSDGTAAGTVLVKDIIPGSAGPSLGSLTNVNGTLYFVATDSANGQELWKSDGTAAGTVLVKDIRPGSSSSSPQSLTNVNGTLYFSANNGVNGSELWKSDGTAAGTVLVQDIYPGSSNASPLSLTQAAGSLFFSATTPLHGAELWVITDGDVVPPTVTCPPDQNAKATSASGASVTYPPATATDDRTASPRITYSLASGALFALGSTPVTVTATDDSGNTAHCGFTVTVVPPEPVVTDPRDGASSTSPVVVAGTALAGATVTALEGTTVLGTFTADASGAFGGTLVLESRVYSVRYTQTLSGSTSAPTAAYTLFVRPPPPSITAPADGFSTTSPSVFVAGSGLPGATLTVVSNGGVVLATLTVDSAGSFAGTVSLSSYGVHLLRFTQRTSGGTSEETSVHTVILRPQAPSLTRPAPGSSLVGPTVLVEGKGVAGATATVIVDDTAIVGRFAVALDGTFSGSVTLEYGSRQLTAVQTAGGQDSAASAPVSIEVRPPAPDVSAPASGSTLVGPVVSVAGTGLPGAQVRVREAGTVLATLAASASGAFAGDVELAPGTHELTFVQTVGGATSDARGPQVVHVQPPAPLLTMPASQARVPGPKVALEGTAVAGAHVSVEAAGNSLGSTSAGPDGTFRLTVWLAYGPHTLSLRQEAGGFASPARTVELTVIPAPPVLAQPLDGAIVGSRVEVKGLGVPRADILLRDGGDVIATLQVGEDGTFSTGVSFTYGPHTLTAVQRMDGEESDTSAPVHLNAVFNRAPIADAQELSVAEDGRLEVELTASDGDGDKLTFTLQTPPAHGTLEGTPPKLTYVPEPDFHGADRFTFAVSDGELEATATVRLTVTPVNDAPVASALGATTAEGHPISLTLTGGDIDGDSLTYEVVTAPKHGSLQGTPPEVTYSPAPGFAGGDVFTFRVSDGQSESAPATVSVRVVSSTLTVSASDVSPLEGSAVTFSAALSDASATPVLVWDFGDGSTSTEATPRHAFRDNGSYTVVVRATDADGMRQASLTVTVRNAPPVVEALTLPTSASETQEVVLTATAADSAGSADTLEYQWNFGDGSPEASGPTVRHAFRDDGSFTIVLTVRDEDGGETRAQATFTVSNVPPSAPTPERQSIRVGDTLGLQLSASDVAGTEDPLTWKKLSGPGAVTPEGLFTWVPTQADVGEASVRLEVSDDEGGRVEVTLVVEVLPLDVVDAGGCGCRAGGGSSGLLALLFVLGGLAQRRRRVA